MKLNKKGFMLAEVVIVASVIATVLVFLYISINRMSNAYDKRNRYYDIDAMYAAMEINNSISDSFDSTQDCQIIDNNNRFVNYYNGNNNLKNTITAFYVKSGNSSLEKLNSSLNNNNYLKEYISYLEDNIDFDNYNYLIIVELIDKNNQDNIHFYTLKVGDTNETQS